MRGLLPSHPSPTPAPHRKGCGSPRAIARGVAVAVPTSKWQLWSVAVAASAVVITSCVARDRLGESDRANAFFKYSYRGCKDGVRKDAS